MVKMNFRWGKEGLQRGLLGACCISWFHSPWNALGSAWPPSEFGRKAVCTKSRGLAASLPARLVSQLTNTISQFPTLSRTSHLGCCWHILIFPCEIILHIMNLILQFFSLFPPQNSAASEFICCKMNRPESPGASLFTLHLPPLQMRNRLFPHPS